MKKKILVLHPFDSFAGSQKVTVGAIKVFEGSFDRIISLVVLGGGGFLASSSNSKFLFNVSRGIVRKVLYVLTAPFISVLVLFYIFLGFRIYASTYYSTPYLLLASIVRPSWVILHVHEIEVPSVLRRFGEFLSSRGCKLLFVSDLHRRRIALAGAIVHNFSDSNFGDLYLETRVSRTRLIFVGAPTKSKGFDFFASVTRELVGPNVEALAFIGDSIIPDASACNGHIKFFTSVYCEEKIFSGKTLLLVCSDANLVTETFSLSCMEALKHGALVCNFGSDVCSEIFGAYLVIDDSTRDVKAAVVKLKLVLDTFHDYRKLREDARIYVLRNFGFEKFEIDISKLFYCD